MSDSGVWVKATLSGRGAGSFAQRCSMFFEYRDYVLLSEIVDKEQPDFRSTKGIKLVQDFGSKIKESQRIVGSSIPICQPDFANRAFICADEKYALILVNHFPDLRCEHIVFHKQHESIIVRLLRDFNSELTHMQRKFIVLPSPRPEMDQASYLRHTLPGHLPTDVHLKTVMFRKVGLTPELTPSLSSRGAQSTGEIAKCKLKALVKSTDPIDPTMIRNIQKKRFELRGTLSKLHRVVDGNGKEGDDGSGNGNDEEGDDVRNGNGKEGDDGSGNGNDEEGDDVRNGNGKEGDDGSGNGNDEEGASQTLDSSDFPDACDDGAEQGYQFSDGELLINELLAKEPGRQRLEFLFNKVDQGFFDKQWESFSDSLMDEYDENKYNFFVDMIVHPWLNHMVDNILKIDQIPTAKFSEIIYKLITKRCLSREIIKKMNPLYLIPEEQDTSGYRFEMAWKHAQTRMNDDISKTEIITELCAILKKVDPLLPHSTSINLRQALINLRNNLRDFEECKWTNFPLRGLPLLIVQDGIALRAVCTFHGGWFKALVQQTRDDFEMTVFKDGAAMTQRRKWRHRRPEYHWTEGDR